MPLLSGIRTGDSLSDKIFFRVNHPLYPTVLSLLLIIPLMWAGQRVGHYSWLQLVLWFVVGFFSWTLVEYFLHRVIFHWNLTKEPWRSMATSIHLAHHRDTEDKYMLFPPLTISVVIGAFLYLLFVLFSWSWSLGAILVSGLLAGYALYEWAHYAAHQYQPKNRAAKYMKKFHLAHHFKAPKKFFGVTNPFWDWVFGTFGSLKVDVKAPR